MVSTQTLLVIISNLSIGIISMATMMVVFFQAPRVRTNQFFAMMMLTLGSWGLLNVIGRFLSDIDIDPAIHFGMASFLYILFFALLYFFSEEFTASPNPFLRWFGIAFLLMMFGGIISGEMFEPPRLSEQDAGGYVFGYKPFGLFGFAVGIMYLVLIVRRLHTNPDPRARALRPAGYLLMMGVVMLLLRPLSENVGSPWDLVLTFPWSSMTFSIASLVMARAVLQVQLFDPMRQLNQQLRQKNDELEEADRLKDQFLANVSHELRTPLNAIIGYTELTRNGVYGSINEQQAERLSKVVVNSRHLLELINDVLDLSKINAGQMELKCADFDLSAMLQEVVTSVTTLAEDKGLALHLECPEGLMLHADEPRLRQVFINLAGNAIKFTEQGSMIIRAKQASDLVRVSVEDTGIGITRENHHLIFDEFRQADGGSTRKYQGTGLGLAISKRIVDMHAGSIHVQSAPGEGSTFTVVLPLDAT